MPRRKYNHILLIEVSSDVDSGQRQMLARVIRWLETNGHTAAGHGFEFRRVGVPSMTFIGDQEDGT